MKKKNCSSSLSESRSFSMFHFHSVDMPGEGATDGEPSAPAEPGPAAGPTDEPAGRGNEEPSAEGGTPNL